MKFSKVFILSFCFIFLFTTVVSANSLTNRNNKAEVIETVEQFWNETYELVEDEIVFTGYKFVSAITELTIKDGYPIKSSIKSIEDYYDNDVKFIKSVVNSEQFINNYSSGTAISTTKTKEYKQPLLKNANIDININSIQSIPIENSAEKAKIKKGILEQVDKIKVEKSEEVQGFTYKSFNELREIGKNLEEHFYDEKSLSVHNNSISKSREQVTILNHYENCPVITFSIERCGAFDNYYNHNISTGGYTVQVLTYDSSGNLYARVIGNVSGKPATAQLLGQYKSIINNYDLYVQKRMDSMHWSETVGWVSGIAGMAVIVVGFVVGPLGWVQIVTGFSGALFTLAGLTSSAYATATRLSYSGTAASYLHNANKKLAEIMNKSEWDQVQYVSGF